MKKLILVLALTFLGSTLFAGTTAVWRSSNTQTADTTQNLCKPGNKTGVTVHGLFHGACINKGATGSLSIFNSSGTSTSPIAVMDTSTTLCGYYDVAISSGLTYTNSATANVTILFDCY